MNLRHPHRGDNKKRWSELLPVFRTGLILNGLGLCKGLVPILHRGQALKLFL